MDKYKKIWDELKTEAKKTNCKKRGVACIIYNKVTKEVVGIGHNNHPDGLCDCGSTRTALHAEQMAVKNLWGTHNKEDLIAFINHAPCYNCARVLDTYVSEVRYRSQD